MNVSQPGIGADRFTGYEISLETTGKLVIGRHRQNWEPLLEVPCNVPLNEWISLSVELKPKSLVVFVNGQRLASYEDKDHPLEAGAVGLRTWQREARYRNFKITTNNTTRALEFKPVSTDTQASDVSGMWRALKTNTATGSWRINRKAPFSGTQSQSFAFQGGQGAIGIENQGLNRQGIYFKSDQPYEGFIYVRAAEPAELQVALESRDGSTILAEETLQATQKEWQRLNFKLTPKADELAGRFTIKLKKAGSVDVGYAFLQPGDWGRFKGLPVRRDVAEGLLGQGIPVLRYGGSMVNHPEYRWKKMIGPRENRPPYRGWWYAQSSNGWGIFDFLNFCEAAGIPGIPALHFGESPEDIADFMEYVNGPATTPWGQKRAADGHPAPYGLKYLELGNEERVDDAYAAKFEEFAKRIWAKDSQITLIVGDFVYGQPIRDPFKFSGAASGITSLAGQQRILKFAKQNNREVWFDLHVGTDGPRPDSTFSSMFTFRDALANLADGARHKVVIFEFNSGNHTQRRALANALAINAIERDGKIPIALAANCLQVDRQNDNGWNQGLLFMNPKQVWLQPPGHVAKMFSTNYQPLALKCNVSGAIDGFDVSVKKSDDGRTLTIQAVNPTDHPQPATIAFRGFKPVAKTARVLELAGELNAANTDDKPQAIAPTERDWPHAQEQGESQFTFAPRSVTVIRLK